ncbi:hypothetical protein SAY87_020166 [Trapa incisa]|uniref:Uncharacterized protein n=1 Tax=Trapa incisa TaxID=236973 RepID=A0AAN7K123_9MYRT|nr:hypothetical protein SAY87_020166 [Trapa incisa]
MEANVLSCICEHTSKRKPGEVLPTHEPSVVKRAINHFLQKDERDIMVVEVRSVPSDFHDRYNARESTYFYRLLSGSGPLSSFEKDRAWHVREVLDVKAMQEACKVLVGHHDFSSFRSARCRTNCYGGVQRRGVQRRKSLRRDRCIHNIREGNPTISVATLSHRCSEKIRMASCIKPCDCFLSKSISIPSCPPPSPRPYTFRMFFYPSAGCRTKKWLFGSTGIAVHANKSIRSEKSQSLWRA